MPACCRANRQQKRHTLRSIGYTEKIPAIADIILMNDVPHIDHPYEGSSAENASGLQTKDVRIKVAMMRTQWPSIRPSFFSSEIRHNDGSWRRNPTMASKAEDTQAFQFAFN